MPTIDVNITSNGEMMFFKTQDGAVVAWDVKGKKVLAERQFEAGAIIIWLNKTTAIVAVRNEIYVWDLVSNDAETWCASILEKTIYRSLVLETTLLSGKRPFLKFQMKFQWLALHWINIVILSE
jgi:hypothetical protein